MGQTFISYRAVVERTSLSRSTIERMVSAGTFPKPVAISPGRLAFTADAVDAWAQARAQKAAA